MNSVLENINASETCLDTSISRACCLGSLYVFASCVDILSFQTFYYAYSPKSTGSHFINIFLENFLLNLNLGKCQFNLAVLLNDLLMLAREWSDERVPTLVREFGSKWVFLLGGHVALDFQLIKYCFFLKIYTYIYAHVMYLMSLQVLTIYGIYKSLYFLRNLDFQLIQCCFFLKIYPYIVCAMYLMI